MIGAAVCNTAKRVSFQQTPAQPSQSPLFTHWSQRLSCCLVTSFVLCVVLFFVLFFVFFVDARYVVRCVGCCVGWAAQSNVTHADV